MVAIFSGFTTGLYRSSITTLLGRGLFGDASQGRSGEGTYVNVASGDLVLQREDLALVGLGASQSAVRTYNSLGAYDFDGNQDGWQAAPTRVIVRVDAMTLRRYEADGSSFDYTGTDATGYVANLALGSAPDRIVVNADGTYTWTDGATGNTEGYQAGATGRIVWAATPSAITHTFQYDAATNVLKKVVYANGESLEFAYDGNDLRSVTARRSDGSLLATTAYDYDDQHRLWRVAVTTGAGKTYATTYEYEGTSDRLAAVTQSDGSTQRFTYVLVNGEYRIATFTDGENNVARFAYDLAQRKTTVTNDSLGVSNVYGYDANGMLTDVTTGITAATPGGQASVRYEYDAKGDVTKITDGLGAVTTFGYATPGDQTSRVDGAGNRIERTYDASHRLVTETVYAASGATQPETARFVYDATGKFLLRFAISAGGRVTEYQYDSLGRRTRAIEYLAGTYDTSALGSTGVPSESAMQAWAAGLSKTAGVSLTELSYDLRSQLATTTRWDRVQWDATKADWVGVLSSATTRTLYVRDHRGLLIQTRTLDASGTTTSQTDVTYDGFGRVLTTQTSRSTPGPNPGDPPTVVVLSKTTTLYDDAANKTVVELANGLLTTSQYDRAGRLVSVLESTHSEALGTTRYAYDADGNLLMTEDPTGRRTYHVYDASGRKVADVSATRSLTEYVYDANGRVTEVIAYANTVSAAIALVDASGKPVRVTIDALRPAASTADSRSWTLYDAAGRLAWQVDALGYVTQTQYDGASRVISTTRLAAPMDVSLLGNGAGVRLALNGLATTTVLTDTVQGTGPSALHQLKATVAGQAGATLTGTVAFFSGTACLGTAAVVNGVATLSTKLLAGAQSLSAVYSGDTGNVGSASAAVPTTVAATTTTTTTLTVSTVESVLGSPVTLTAQVTGADPTGSVRFYDGGTLLGTVALVDGVASLKEVSSLPAGVRTLTVAYLGDALNAASTSAGVTERVLQATTLGLSAAVNAAGDLVTLTATPGAPSATGSVSFFQGATLLGSSAISGGIAVLKLPALPAGTPIRAVYSGNATYATATSSDVAGPVVQADTTTTLTLDAMGVATAEIESGANLWLTVKVAGALPGGTVTFFDGATVLGTASLSSAGEAAMSVGGRLLEGTHSLTATYAGDASNTASTSAVATVTVRKQATTLSLTSASATTTHGLSVTLNASFGPTGFYTPTGTITFLEGTTVLGTAVVTPGALGGAAASLTLNNLSVGAHAITATYSGDGGALSSVSPAFTQTVNVAPTTVKVTATPVYAPPGSAVVLRAEVKGSVANVPGGTITFKNGTTVIGTATLTCGVAVLSTTTLPAGWTNITATYAGDASNAAATSAAVGTQVMPSNPISLSSSVSTVAQGTAFTLTATVTTDGTPGLVTFYNGTTVLGVARPVAGKATLSTVLYTTGTASVRAAYEGDGTYGFAQSAAVSVSVTAKTPAPTPPVPPPATTTTLGPIAIATMGSWSERLSVAVTTQPGAPTATGTVSFYAGSTLVGCISLVNGYVGMFAINTALLSPGSYAVTAVYSGDANGASSTSPAGTLTIQKAASAVTLRPSVSTATVGGTVTLSAAVNGYKPGGTVTFYNGATALGTATVTNGVATLSVSLLPLGTNSLTAQYGGDANNTAVTSSATAVVMTPVRATSTVAISSSMPTNAPKGAPVTLTATVTSATPTGTVSFFDGTTLIGSAAVNAGVARLVVDDLSVAAHTLKAVYSGDADTAASVSATIQQSIAKATTTSVLTTSGASEYGSWVTLTAKVSGTGAPTGTVTFKNGTVTLGTATLVDGVATLTLSGLPVGTDALTAVYAGDAGNVTSTSAVASQVVNRTDTFMTVLTSTGAGGGTGPVDRTTAVTLSAWVGADARGYTPTGIVTFFRGNTVLGTATLAPNPVYGATNAVASLVVQGLSIGTDEITASYAGDATAAGCVGTRLLTVDLAQPTVEVSASRGSLALGQPVTLTASVSGFAPSGTVTFYDGDTAIGFGTVVNGIAAITVSNLTAGEHALTARYGGDDSNTAAVTIQVATVSVVAPAIVTSAIIQDGYHWYPTATVTGKAPTGYVMWMSGSTVVGVGTVRSNGIAPGWLSANVDTTTLTTIYSGDEGNAWSSSTNAVPITPFTGTPPNTIATTTTALAVSASPVAGGPVTLTATVTPAPIGSGMVAFFDGARLLGAASVVDGHAILTVDSLVAGTASLKAVFAGDWYTPSTSAVKSVTVGKGPTTTTVFLPATSAVQGAPLTLVARVTGGAGLTGIVTFKAGTTVLGTGTVDASGFAKLENYAGPLALGNLNITAVYGADANNAASTSATAVLSVSAAKAVTTTALSASPATSTFGTPVTLTATVTGTTPGGTVSFFRGTTLLGSAPVFGGAASLKVSDLPAGANAITAVYSGDATKRTSVSGVTTVTVQKVSTTTTTLTTSAATTTYGTAVTLTATVQGAVNPTGVVTFKADGAVVGTAELVDGVATLAYAYYGVGAKSLSAAYGGDANNAASTSASVAETVTLVPSSLARTSPATVSCADPISISVGGRQPTGVVTFFSGTTVLGTATVLNGVATLQGATLPVGTTTLAATYSGDAANATSVIQFSQTVTKAATVTTLSATASGTVAQGGAVRLIARVSGSQPSGNVTFYNGATQLGTAALVNGVAVLSTTALPKGVDNLTAVYVGDARNATSTSAVVAEKILAPAATVALTASPATVQQGAALTLTATVAGASPTGQVTFVAGARVLGVATLAGGTATLTIPQLSLPVGTATIVASYGGDANNGAARSTGTVETVQAGTQVLRAGTGSQDRVETRLYDRDGLLTATIDGEGYLVEYVYDAGRRLVGTTRYTERVVPNFTGPQSIAAAVATARASGSLAGLRPAAAASDVKTFVAYDAQGRKLRELDGEKYLTEWTYDEAGRVRTVTRYATAITTAVSSSAQLVEVKPTTNEEDQTRSYRYDALGRVVVETNAEGTETTYAYDAVGNLEWKRVADGVPGLQRDYQVVTDVQGRVTDEISPGGSTVHHDYDAAGRRTASTDAAGNRTLFFYDDAGRLRYVVNALGEVTETTYDGVGRVSTVSKLAVAVSPSGWTGGLLSARTAERNALTAARTGLVSTTRRTYDAAGRVTTEALDGTLRRTAFTYDAFGGVVKTAERIDATRELVSTAVFDRLGQKIDAYADVGGVGAHTRWRYDGFGRVWSVTDANGVDRTMWYDRLGRIVAVNDPAGSRRTRYDAFDRVLFELSPVQAARLTGNAAADDVVWDTYGTRYSYDRLARAVTVRSPEGVQVKTTHDRHGQTVAVEDGSGVVTSYGYDVDGKLLSRSVVGKDGTTTVDHTKYKGNTGLVEATWTTVSGQTRQFSKVQYGYDAANRVLKRVADPDGAALTTEYAFDAKGQQVTVTENGVVTRTTFDLTGDVLTRVVDPTVSHVEQQWDDWLEDWVDVEVIDHAGLDLKTTYTRDARGNVLTVDAPEGRTKYVYDNLGRRTEVIVDPGTPPSQLNLRTLYGYDANGNVVTTREADGSLTRFVYDASNRLVCTIDGAGGVVLSQYDADGRVTVKTTYTSFVDLVGLTDRPTLQQVKDRIAAAAQVRSTIEWYRYDYDGRLRYSVDGAHGVTRFTYDGNGNVVERRTYAEPTTTRLSFSGAFVNPPATDPVVVETAARDQRVRTVYDALDRAILTIDGAGAVVKQTYDGAGNVVDRYAYAKPVTGLSNAAQLALGDVILPSADPSDAHLRRVYDGANRLVWSWSATGIVAETGAIVGAVTKQEYDAAGNLAKVIQYAERIGAGAALDTAVASDLDRVTIMGYDAAHRRTVEVDPLGSVTRAYHDAAGNVVRKVAFANRLETQDASLTQLRASTRVADALAAAARLGDGTPANGDRISRAFYDAANRLAFTVDASGAAVKYVRDGVGDVVVTTAYATRYGTPDAAGAWTAKSPAPIPALDAVNDRITLSGYDGAHRLQYTVDATGAVTETTYDAAGRVEATTLHVTRVSVVPFGSLVSSVAAGGGAAAIARELTAATADQTTRYGYDGAGRTTSVTDARNTADSTETYRYDGTGAKVSFTNKLGNTWTYAYDAAGRPLTETAPPVIQRLAADGTPLATPTPAPAVVTQLTYDALGNLLSRTEAHGLTRPDGTSEARTTRYAYDAGGRQVRTTFPAAKVYDREKDFGTGAITTAGLVDRIAMETTDAVVVTSEVTYDAFGDAVVNKDASGNRSYKAYDLAGRVRYDVDAEGYVTEYGRNAFGDATSLTRYEARGTLASTSTAPYSTVAVAGAIVRGPGDRVLTTTYDAMGRATLVTQPAVWANDAQGWSGSLAPATETQYDAFGQVALVRQRASATTWLTAAHYYDGAGREVVTVDAGGYVAKQSYDAAGNLESRTEYAAALASWSPATRPSARPTATVGAGDRTVTYTYDAVNRRLTEVRHDVQVSAFDRTSGVTTQTADLTTSFGYDAVGNLVWTLDPAGALTRTYYDVLGRTEAVLAPQRDIYVTGTAAAITASPLTVFRRDALGNVVTTTEFARGAATATATVWTAVADGGDRVTRTKFDERGNAIEVTDALGIVRYTAYDAAGRVAKTWQGVERGTDGKFARTHFTVFEYDRNGNQTAVITPASTQSYALDPTTQAWKWKVLTQAQAGTVTERTDYDAFGEVKEKATFKTGTAPTARETFDYDLAGRVWRSNSGDGSWRIFLYDLAGRQTSILQATGAESVYAADGTDRAEVFFRSFASAEQADGAVLRRTDSAYDRLGRVWRTTYASRTNPGGAEATRPFVEETHDRWGNVIARADPRSAAWTTYFTYDAFDRLVKVVQPTGAAGTPETRYFYDAVGRQIATRDARGNVNGQVFDVAGQLLEEVHADADATGGVVRRRYDAFGDQVAVQDAEGHWKYYDFDELGRNTKITTEAVDVYSVDWTDWSNVSSVNRAIVTTITYDDLGNKIRETDGTVTESWAYDLQGNLVTSWTERDRRTIAYDVWGRRVAERDALGNVARWTYDDAGRLSSRVDIGGREYWYKYDVAGQLTGQTGPSSLGQDLLYTYDAAGQLVRIQDRALYQETIYAYNAAGKRILERVVQNGVVYQDQWLAYDELGRLAVVNALDGADVTFEYDAVGNKLHQSIHYRLSTKSGTTYAVTSKDQDLWFAYDTMNRATLVDGALNGDATDLANVTATQGHILTYDHNGNRTSDRTWGARVTVTKSDVTYDPPTYSVSQTAVRYDYAYDPLGRLSQATTEYVYATPAAIGSGYNTTRKTTIVDTRAYDGASRVVRSGAVGGSQTILDHMASFDATVVGNRITLNDFDYAGNLIAQRSSSLAGGAAVEQSFQTQYTTTETVEVTTYNTRIDDWVTTTKTITETHYRSNYDAAGNLKSYTSKDVSSGIVTTNENVYEKADRYRVQRSTAKRSDSSTTAIFTNVYDRNGYLTGVDATKQTGTAEPVDDPAKNRTMVNDATGKVLFRNQDGNLMRQLVVDGNVVGVYGVGQDPRKPSSTTLVAQANFDLNYQPITSSFPSAGSGEYQVQAGDTLQAIAQSAYGDTSLWWVIADANALRDDSDLRVGATLTIPTRPTGAGNKAGTYGSYDPSRIVGDTTPTAPPPKAPKQCSGAARFWATVLVVAVAVVVSVATYGAASWAMASLGAWASTGAGTLATAVVAGAAAGAASSAASQLVSWGIGLSDSFSWKDVGIAALSGAVTGAVGKGLEKLGLVAKSGPAMWGTKAAKAMISSAITQQAQAVIWSKHEDFSWAAVAAAGVGGAMSGAMSEAFGLEQQPSGWGDRAKNAVLGTFADFQSGVFAAAIRGGTVDPGMVAADAFGNALGSSLGDLIEPYLPKPKVKPATPASEGPAQASGGTGFQMSQEIRDRYFRNLTPRLEFDLTLNWRPPLAGDEEVGSAPAAFSGDGAPSTTPEGYRDGGDGAGGGRFALLQSILLANAGVDPFGGNALASHGVTALASHETPSPGSLFLSEPPQHLQASANGCYTDGSPLKQVSWPERPWHPEGGTYVSPGAWESSLAILETDLPFSTKLSLIGDQVRGVISGSPRAQGAIGVVDSSFELGAAVMVTPEIPPLGIGLGIHAADRWAANLQQLVTGEPTDTALAALIGPDNAREVDKGAGLLSAVAGGASAINRVAAVTAGPRTYVSTGVVDLSEFQRLNMVDETVSRLRPSEARAAAELQEFLGGTLDRYRSSSAGSSGAAGRVKSPDYVFVTGPHKGESVDFFVTADDPFRIENLNQNFGRNLRSLSVQLDSHLDKADIVPIDMRILNPDNQNLLFDLISRQSRSRQQKIILFE